MSGSETQVISSRDPFSVGLHKSPLDPQSVVPNMFLAFSGDGTAVFKPVPTISPSYQSPGSGFAGVDGSTGGTGAHGLGMIMGSEPTKRKRGRPRKYGADGTISLVLSSAPPSASGSGTQSGGDFSPSPTGPSASGGLGSPSSAKKARGRPPGSRGKQQALGSTGVGFTPHVITVKAGEDVSSKIMSFSQSGPRAVCILSANGAISNVTLRQPATFGGTVTYEGRYEILSLSGSFLLGEKGGQRSRTGGLSVSLCGPDGRVLGGSVAGLVTAASSVQVVVGSFIADGRKESKPTQQRERIGGPPRVESIDGYGDGDVDPTGGSSPHSGGSLSESSGSPPYQSSGACHNTNLHGLPRK